MRTLGFVFHLCLLIILVKAQDGIWMLQNSNIGDDLSTVFFLDANTGWAGGRTGKIIKTTDGGTNWILQNSNYSDDIRSIFFINSSLGWAAGIYSGVIIKTTNGGNTWTQKYTNFGAHPLNQIFFVNQSLGFIVSDYGGVILKTTDGGENWVSISTNNSQPLKSVYFLDNLKGFAVGVNYTLLKTTDGGNTWNRVNINNTFYSFNKIFFRDNMTGWICGEIGTVLKTTDGGNNWTSQNINTQTHLNDIVFTSLTNGWVVGEMGQIYKTTNGGTQWLASNANTDIDFSSIAFPDAQTGYVVGQIGRIYKYNSQVSGIVITSPTSGTNWQVGASQNITWATNLTDLVKIEYSTNNGTSYTQIEPSYPAPVLSRNWTVPNTPSTQCKIKITSLSNPSIYAVSSTFAILGTPAVGVTVIYPNGGENIDIGSQIQVAWFATNIQNVKIELSTDGGSSFPVTIASSVPANQGNVPWTVGNYPSTRCRIKISDVSNSNVNDISNSNFTIKSTTSSWILLRSPNGGENYQVGENISVWWNRYNVLRVKVDLSSDNGNTWITKVSSHNDVNQDWVNFQAPNYIGNEYRVRVSDVNNPSVSDMSDRTFSVSNNINKFIYISNPSYGQILTPGELLNVHWYGTGFDRVKLQFSTDNGFTWRIITNDTVNVNRYNWRVPYLYTNVGLLRVSDAYNSNLYDEVAVKITSQFKYITLFSPNGGEVLSSGNIHKIRFEARAVENVKIEWSSNNGGSWNYLNTVNGLLGFCDWPIPYINSTTCLVKVTDATDEQMFDESNNVFSIENYYLKLVYPNGGQRFGVGQDMGIVWNALNINKINIDLTTNDGINWIPVATNITASDRSYNFTVPNLISNQCRIKLTDVSNSKRQDSSKSLFTIFKANINVVFPNGGNQLKVGSVQNITWTQNDVTSIAIDLTTDNGSTWIQLEPNYPASNGSYQWTVPDYQSSLCKIRLTERINNTVTDISDNTFQIYKQKLILTYPTGGEFIRANSVDTIKWNSAFVNTLTIKYSTTAGIFWTTITNSASGTAQKYVYTFPNVITDRFRISIEDASNSELKSSSQNFTLFDLWQPLPSGATTDFYTLDFYNPYVGFVAGKGGKVIGTFDGGYNWNDYSIVSAKSIFSINAINSKLIYAFGELGSGYKTDVGGYYWYKMNINTTKNLNSSYFFDDKSGYVCGDGGLIITTADSGKTWAELNSGTTTVNFRSIFFISKTTGWVCGTNGKIYKTTNSGTTWTQLNSNQTVSLNSIFFTDENTGWCVGAEGKIIKTTNGGQTWVSQTNPSPSATLYSCFFPSDQVGWAVGSGGLILNTTNGGSNWVISQSLTTNDLFDVQLKSLTNGYAVGKAGTILKLNPNAQLKITFPIGGEGFQGGTTQKIRWTSRMVSNVKIEIALNGTLNWQTIVASTPAATGYYDWTVPVTTAFNNRIRITDVNNISLYDQSGPFSIATKLPLINLVTPNGGEIWQRGTQKKIKWTYQVLDSIKIEYTTNNGTTYNLIESNFPTANLEYDWVIPNTPSTQCRVKISGQGRVDSSSNLFTILNSPIIVTSPNGGENFEGGKTSKITWISNVSTNLKLEYTSNAGTSWNIITSSVPSSPSSYNWNVPSINSSQCKVRITDVNNSANRDTSDELFTIFTKTITVTYPNGGEILGVGTNHNITWEHSNIEKVNILITTNQGLSWLEIASNIDSSVRSFNYYVPLIPSNGNKCKIKICDANDPLLYDMSNSFFSIVATEWFEQNSNSAQNFNSLYFRNNLSGWAAGDSSLMRTTDGGENWLRVFTSQFKLNGVYYTSDEIGFLCDQSGRILKTTDGGTNWTVKYFVNETNLYSIYFPSQAIGYAVGQGKAGTSSLGMVIYKTTNGGDNWSLSLHSTTSQASLYDVFFISENIGWAVGSFGVVQKTTNGGTSWSLKQLNSSYSLNSCYFVSENVGFIGTSTSVIYKTTDGGANYTSINSTNSSTNALFFTSANDGWAVGNYGLIAKTTNGGNNWINSPTTTTNILKALFSAGGNIWAAGSGGKILKRNQISSLQITSPTENDTLKTGRTFAIKWNYFNVSNILIQYSINNGESWIGIENSYSTNNDSLIWTVPNTPSANCLLKITDVGNSNVFNVSKKFVIIPAELPSIVVISPNGGELHKIGSQINIQWNSSLVQRVKIDYTTNYGTDWITVTNSAPVLMNNNSTYSWVIPNTPSQRCKIRISDTNNTQISDVSDEAFTIYRPNLFITAPNGSEVWYTGTQQQIRWVSEYVSKLKIEITTNNGTNWILITNNATAGDGIYNYNVPNYNSTQCKIRITDSSNSSLFSISNGVFTIKERVSDWVKLNSNVSQNLNSVIFVDHLNGWVVGNSGITVRTSDGGINWTSSTISTTSNIKSVFFIDKTTGWLCGDYGTIFKTTNGGASWYPRNFSTYHYSSIFFKTINNGWMTGYLGYLYRSSDAGENWGNYYLTNVSFLYSLYFADLMNGWAVGTDGNLFKTTNGGVNWSSKQSNTSNRLNSVRFASSLTGWAVGNNGTIIKTTNAGDNWFLQSSNTTNNLKSVYFSNINNGWAVGEGGLILKTSDGGSNWINEYSGTNKNLNSVNVTSSGSIYAVGDSGLVLYFNSSKIQVLAPLGGETLIAGTNYTIRWLSPGINTLKIYYSTNSGIDWNIITNSVSAASGFYNWTLPNLSSTKCRVKISSVDDSTISMTIPIDFSIIKNLWVPSVSPVIANLNCTYFVDLFTGWACGDGGLIIKTTNGGESWTQQTSGTTSNLNNINFVTSTLGWAFGNTGRIIKTTNGGVWLTQPTPTSYNIYSSSFLDNITGWFVGEQGRIYKTTNGGTNWTQQTSGITDPLYSVAFLDQNTGWTVGGTSSTSRILKTTNGGDTWLSQTSPVNTLLRIVSPVNENLIFAAGTNSIIKTTNGGTTWTSLTNPSLEILVEQIYALRFINSSIGYIGTASGAVYYTIDGGATWVKQKDSDTRINHFYFVNQDVGYAVCNEGKIYKQVTTENLSVLLNSPNGGEVWKAGTNQTITWTTQNVPNLKISYTTNNGLTWILINANVPSSAPYNWTIPQTPSTKCRVKIEDVRDSVIYDISNNLFTISTQSCKELNLSSGWNLISVPLVAQDMSKTALFPTAISSAYDYTNTYLVADTLKNMRGYWLKFQQNEAVNICGNLSATNSRTLNQGWNIIGLLENNISVNSIVTNPPGIISSMFYGYSNGYFNADTLKSGKGYWVKVSQGGTIQFASNQLSKSNQNNEIIYSSVQKIMNDAKGYITVSDNCNNINELYFINTPVELSNFELPPIPPSPAYDVRFENNQRFGVISEGIPVLLISSDKYPVKIKAYGINLLVKDVIDGKQINKKLFDGEEFSISNSKINKLNISILEIPTVYSLSQNYPNPFNPITKLKYGLPENSRIKVNIYSVLGELVQTLMNGVVEAGNDELVWDAGKYASGVYILRFEAEGIKTGKSFNSIKKLILLK